VRRAAANPGQVRNLRRQVESYRRVLPSLDLKRRQLSAALARERRDLAQARVAFETALTTIGSELPMLAGAEPSLDAGIAVHLQPAPTQMIAGVPVEGFAALEVTVTEQGLCGAASWVDGLVEAVRLAAELRLRAAACERRAAQLDAALRRASQRVNLLEKLLIPRTEQRLHSVEVLLGDLKRAEVIRAKIAKSRQHA
jgi:V/A-type H+-transporting ATPase subunit D